VGAARLAVRLFVVLLGALCSAALACSSPAAPVTYCDVQPITESRCERCHTEPPENGAPFSLVGYAATQESYEGEPIYERMGRAVRTDFMPPVTLSVDPPVVDLTSEEVETIGAWADAGAPPGDCD